MRYKKLFLTLFLIIFVSGLLIIALLFCISISTSLKESLISTIVGSGLFGGVIAWLFFYLQSQSEYEASKTRAQSFFDNKLILDILEADSRGDSPWNFSGLNKFYFDSSKINSLFDVYQNNESKLNDFLSYFSKNKLANTYRDFYRLARKGYVLGERLEGMFYQVVRVAHHKEGLISANDSRAIAYLKGRLFTNLSSQDINRYLEWEAVPERLKKLEANLSKNKDFVKAISELRETRKKLIDLSAEVIKLAKL